MDNYPLSSYSPASFLKELANELDRVLSFWTTKIVDEVYGGFIGQIDGFGRPRPFADKSIILNARLLWSYATAARLKEDRSLRPLANRSFAYLRDNFLDRDHGGVYWSLDHSGKVRHAKKQVYAQAFTIYGCAAYYQLTGHFSALELASSLFDLLETHSKEPVYGGYLEAHSQQWRGINDMRLSDKDANAAKTMNTHLHILEAYTALYLVYPKPVLKKALLSLLDLFYHRFVNHQSKHLHLFFNQDWTIFQNGISYGHDIESAWLLCEAAHALKDPTWIARTQELAVEIARVTLNEGMDSNNGGLNNELVDGHLDTEKHWWVQAEAMVGFLEAFLLSGEEQFYNAACQSWTFIKDNLVDHEHGEWLWGLTINGLPNRNNDKVGPWKAPYHNIRACLEAISRLKKITNDNMVVRYRNGGGMPPM